MAAASVFSSPPYLVSYDVDTGSYVQYDTIVMRNVEAYADETLGPQTLTLGGSSNVDIEGNNVRLFTSNGALQYYWSTFSNSVRTDTLAVQFACSNDTCKITSDGALSLQGGDTNNTVAIGDITFQYDSDSNVEWLTTNNSNGFRFNNSLICDGTVTVLTNQNIGQNLNVGNDINIGRNLTVQENVLASSVGMYKNIAGVTTSNAVDQVGFAFNINDTNQLELIRYVRFFGASNGVSSNPLTVTQRVGVFGHGNVSTLSSSDTTINAFDQLNGYMVGSNGSNLDPNGSVNISSVWGTNIAGNLFYNGGLVGINKTTPMYTLDVGGTVQALNLQVTQGVTCPAYYSTSDMRLKQIIGRSDVADCYDKVLSTNVTQFVFNNDPDHRTKTGFIAQEIEQIMPDAIYTGASETLDDCKFIEPAVMIGYAVGAIQHTAALQKNLNDQHLALCDQHGELHATLNDQHTKLQGQIDELRSQLVGLVMSLRRVKVI